MTKLAKLLGLFNLYLVIALTTVSALAQDYVVPLQGPLQVSISDKGVNRIVIENDRIAQVIGNEDEYIIESDTNLGQIFLTPVLKAPKDISVRFVTEREKIVDVKFAIKSIEPQTINIKYNQQVKALSSDSSTNSPLANNLAHPMINALPQQSNSNNAAQQIIELIKSVHQAKLAGIDLPTLGCIKQNPQIKNIKLGQVSQYNLKKQLLIKAIITNKSQEPILLKEQDFSNCLAFVSAVALDKSELKAGESAIIYVVGKDGK